MNQGMRPFNPSCVGHIPQNSRLFFLTPLSAFAVLFPMFYSQPMPSCLAPPQTPPTLPMSAQDIPPAPSTVAQPVGCRVGDGGGSELIKVYPVLSKTGAQISAEGDP